MKFRNTLCTDANLEQYLVQPIFAVNYIFFTKFLVIFHFVQFYSKITHIQILSKGRSSSQERCIQKIIDFF